jgi:hypothetical protein
MSKVKNASGLEIDFDAAVNLMDDDVREKIHGAADTEQEFFAAYERAHEKKYGEPWELSKANPTW